MNLVSPTRYENFEAPVVARSETGHNGRADCGGAVGPQTAGIKDRPQL